MADFKFFPLFVDGINSAEIHGHTVNVKDNGERQMGAGIILGVSQGVPTFDIKGESVCPVAGHSVDMFDLVLTRKEVGVGFNYNGGFYIMPCRVTEADVKSEAKNGTQTGSFTIINSGPAQKVA